MVRLSPKALRFAKDATGAALQRGDAYFRKLPADLFVEYQRLDQASPGPFRYIEVSEPMAKMFLAVLESDLNSNRLDHEDPNDIVFVENIVHSLRDDLRNTA
jgi:hypothetical protein